MGENAQKIGKKLEGFGENLFNGFGWSEIARDLEINCNRKSQHNKQTHGVDIFLSHINPYANKTTGIIVECKNRQWKSINKSGIQGWVDELINLIECAQSSNDMPVTNDVHIDTGLLLVHANDNLFNEEKFHEYVSQIALKAKRNPINIFVAGNNLINQWNSLRTVLDSHYCNGEFKFVYPSINGSQRSEINSISIQHLFSKFIFAQYIYEEKEYDEITKKQNTIHKQENIVFSFDIITKESFQYLWSLFKEYQFESSHRFKFWFYPKESTDLEFTKLNFIKSLKESEPPLPVEYESKIFIDFIDNRTLSPLDTTH